MKVIFKSFITLFMFFLIPFHAFAGAVTGNFSYDAASNTYHLDTTYNWTYTKISFSDSSGTYGPYWFKQIPNYAGYYVMTCTGHYTIDFYDTSLTDVEAWQGDTSQIVNGTCKSNFGTSIADPTANLNLTDTNGATGNGLSWSAYPNASSYDVFKNGAFYVNTTNTTYVDPNGSSTDAYEVHALDSHNTIIASANTSGSNQVTSTTGSTAGFVQDGAPLDGSHATTSTGSTGSTGSTCAACQNLTDQLSCPAWNQYMGAFQQTFTNAMNNADWQTIANTIKNTMIPALDTMLGHPAPPPTVIAPPPPQLDPTSGVNRPAEPQDSTPPAPGKKDFSQVQPVQINQDTTGGIDLTGADPTESIPHQAEGYMPKPGQETGGSQPMKKDIQTAIPTSGPAPAVTTVMPSGTGGPPPSNPAPSPTTTTGTPPTPTAPAGSVTANPAPTLPPPQ